MGVKKVIDTLYDVCSEYHTTDPFVLCEHLGYQIRYKNYNVDAMKGYYTKVLDDVYIYINSNLSRFSQSIICAHELGHALMHDNAGNHFGSEDVTLEYEANLFAAYLILDDTFYDIQFKNMNSYLLKCVINGLIC